jgi:pseudoazurin
MLKTALVLLASLLSASLANAATHEIKMLNNGKDGIMVFEPAFLKAKKGDVIKFVPTDAGHDVASVSIPKGAKSWTGEVGKAVTTTLTKEGVYLYECKVHLPMAMIGVIQVGKASNLDDVKKAAASELDPKIAMNKERVAKYLGEVK